MNKKISIFSFFSGAGFLDLGFEMLPDYQVVYVNEFHKAFNDIYQYSRAKMGIPTPIYGHHVEDINGILQEPNLSEFKELINKSKAETLTGIIGGPPCPDFSVAGKNKGEKGENGRLSGIYTEIICKTLPDFFLFENVKGLYRTAKHRAFFEQLKRKFRKAGYFMTERLLNAIEYGAPQDRDRIILIGFRKDIAEKYNLPVAKSQLQDFPWEKFTKYTQEQVHECAWPTTSPYRENVVTEQPEGIIPELTVEYWWRQNDVEHHPNARMFFQPRAGIARFTTKDEGDDLKKCYKRLHRWRYSPTAAYGNNEVHIHPYKPRRISVAEALAIQSLPREYELPMDVSLTDAFKTIGNGVPFVLAKGVASSIVDYITSNSK